MPAYVVALVHSISDPETYKDYVARVEATIRPFGGRFLARKPDPEALEGGPAPSRAVVYEFPDEAQVRAWHASPAYAPVAAMRRASSKATVLLLPAHVGGASRVPLQEVCYVEMVSSDVDATRRACEAAHGWRFGEPTPELGHARYATLPGGALGAIRAPLHPEERPITRAYVRVADVDEASARVAKAGASVILPTMPIEGRGRIAIFLAGGIEQGLWELP